MRFEYRRSRSVVYGQTWKVYDVGFSRAHKFAVGKIFWHHFTGEHVFEGYSYAMLSAEDMKKLAAFMEKADKRRRGRG